jgi:hypothetical protein
MSRRARGRRDAGLNRLSTSTRTIGVATAVVTGLLAVYLGRAFPGHHAVTSTNASPASGTSVTAPASSGVGSTSTGSSTAAPPSAGASGQTSSALTPPAQAPSRAVTPPVVSSGVS